ncbi:MAG TPA: hypothetical protein PKY77_01305 [Phycisphaerae bacterium]|nr:hypothetical protein [Phycisphaerae bacterium]HRY67506.1 hypothetical protein [Phycisphaerae bacterium]HSA24893.1 hypothetical protein [Phycisphaerae bacterium]
MELAGTEDLALSIGSEAGARVWLDDQVVEDWLGYRHYTRGEYRITVKCHPGRRKLMVKVFRGVEHWVFSVGAVDRNGWPAKVTWHRSSE